jgi:hypothetical protein
VATENPVLRIRRLVAEAVRAGQYPSAAAVMKKAGLSRSYLSERQSAQRDDAEASVGSDAARGIAAALGMTVGELLGTEEPGEPPLVDVYPGRAWAIKAARDLELPEAAIQAVLRQDPGHDLPRIAWFKRIEAETESLRPASDITR